MISLIRRQSFVASACVALAFTAGGAFAAPRSDSPPQTREIDFKIMRNGSQIGVYSIKIEDDGSTKIVNFTTDIKVDVLMFTAYRLHHSGREVWSDGHFVSYKGETDDNGKTHKVSLTAGPSGATLLVDGRRVRAPKGTVPSTFWNPKTLTATNVVDPDTGKQTAVKIEDMGPSQIILDGAPQKATHYHVDGLGRDIWMANGAPVRTELKGKDNSKIISELEPSASAQ